MLDRVETMLVSWVKGFDSLYVSLPIHSSSDQAFKLSKADHQLSSRAIDKREQ